MALAWLWSWWRRPPAAPVEVVLFTRQGCHLCEDAWHVLETEQRRHGFHLSIADVDGNPEWQRDYGEHVPVVTVNGRIRFRGRVNGVLLARLLKGEGKRGR